MTFNESPPYSDSSVVSGIEETNIRIDMKIIATVLILIPPDTEAAPPPTIIKKP